ncbi:hypothetical protein FM112_02430 [Gulosibacter sp. 10]|nr:hypothetical protein FM112_02430 [Gulosibacter sp. 10]
MALFVVSPFLLLIGGITVLSTVSRDYFERAMTQCMVGSGMLMLGVAALMTAIVLAGMRTMAQQQLNIMLAAERGEHTPQV